MNINIIIFKNYLYKMHVLLFHHKYIVLFTIRVIIAFTILFGQLMIYNMFI
jgi:hypothetical protein